MQGSGVSRARGQVGAQARHRLLCDQRTYRKQKREREGVGVRLRAGGVSSLQSSVSSARLLAQLRRLHKCLPSLIWPAWPLFSPPPPPPPFLPSLRLQ